MQIVMFDVVLSTESNSVVESDHMCAMQCRECSRHRICNLVVRLAVSQARCTQLHKRGGQVGKRRAAHVAGVLGDAEGVFLRRGAGALGCGGGSVLMPLPRQSS